MRIKSEYLTDERIRVPLPIFPRAELPSRSIKQGQGRDRIADEHHPAKGKIQLIHGTVSARALRYARSQWSMYDDHHDGIHRNGLSTVLPMKERTRYVQVSMLTAGALPGSAVGFRRTKYGLSPRIVPLQARDRQLMWERGDVKIDKRIPVDHFLVWHTIASGVPLLGNLHDQRLKKEFLDDPSQDTTRLTNRLAELSTVASGLKEVYRGAREAGFLPPDAPISAKAFVIGRVAAYSALDPAAYGGNAVEVVAPVNDMLLRAMQGMATPIPH